MIKLYVVVLCLGAGLVLGCGDETSGEEANVVENTTPRIFNPGTTGTVPNSPEVYTDTSSVEDAAIEDGEVVDTADSDGSAAEVDGDGTLVDAEVDAGPQVTWCDDKVPCTIETVLTEDGKCEGGKFICGDCAGSGCNFASDCTPFNDDNPCNGVLDCVSGHCVVDQSSVISCSGQEAESPNERIRCSPSNGLCEAEALPDGAACDDGNPCTLYDLMFGGQCGGTDVCASCEALADGSACDDGNPCTDSTLCTGGRCIGANVCECLFSKDCVAQEDGNACNGRMTCIAGSCQVNPDTVVHCQRACPTDSCYQGDCIDETGTCIGKSIPDCE